MKKVRLHLLKKRKLWKKYKYNRNPQNKKKYEEARNEVNRLVRKAKYEYERSIVINMKEDSKIVCKFIQSKTKTKQNIPCIIDEKGEINTNDRIKAELMKIKFKMSSLSK